MRARTLCRRRHGGWRPRWLRRWRACCQRTTPPPLAKTCPPPARRSAPLRGSARETAPSQVSTLAGRHFIIRGGDGKVSPPGDNPEGKQQRWDQS
eukprot:9432831-Pyramimonas_sp.AAC.1